MDNMLQINELPSPPPAPFIDVSVANFAQLLDAINNASPGYILNIIVTASFPMTGTVTIDHGAIATIRSGPGGPYTLTRNTTGILFNVAALNYNGIELSNIIIDGNSAAYPSAGGPLVRGGIGTSIAIGPGTELINNIRGTAPESGGGAVDARSATLVMTGGRIAGNRGSFGGGINTDHATFDMFGGIIENNVAQYDGGGIYSGYQRFVLHDGIIRNNMATQQYGGGVSIDNGTFIMYDGAIQGNTSYLEGGGVEIGGAVGAMAMHGGTISGNTSQSADGGGIYFASSSPTLPTLEIDGDSVLSTNAAPMGNGGAIAYRYEEQLPIINIGPNVVFYGNSASQAYQIAPADIPLHNAHVLTHSFTAPFAYGYNNYDILYTFGTPVTVIEVSYQSNGGSAVPGQPQFAGSPAIQPPNPTRPGYSFCGWYTDPQLSTPWNFANPVNASMTLYACWIPLGPNEHVVSFNSNGGSAVPDQIVPDGAMATQPPNPTRNCDVFDGWYADPTLTIPWNFATPIFADTALYASWIPVACPPSCPCRPCRPCCRCWRCCCPCCRCNPCRCKQPWSRFGF